MNNQEILAPKYILPELPIDVNKEIVKNISPYDIPSFCYTVKTSKGLNPNQCNNVLERYYGRKGMEIFSKLSVSEIEKLNGCIWPTLEFVRILVNNANNVSKINNILDVFDRAFSLKYDEDTLKNMIFSTNSNSSGIINKDYVNEKVDGILFKYNRLDVLDVHRRDYKNMYVSDYIENGGDISNLVGYGNDYLYSDPYRLLERLTYSTLPRLLFSKLKSYIFDKNLNKRDVDYFLIDLYNKPLEEAHKLIFDNTKLIADTLGRIAYCVYTQRPSYDYNMAGYLIQLAKRRDYIDINSDVYYDLYRYSICMNDINLYKITTYIINRNEQMSYDKIKNLDVNNIPISSIDTLLNQQWYEYEYNYDPLFAYISQSFIQRYGIPFDYNVGITFINGILSRDKNGGFGTPSYNIISLLALSYFGRADDYVKLLKLAIHQQV